MPARGERATSAAHVVGMDNMAQASHLTASIPLPRPPALPNCPPDALVVDIVTAAADHGWGWSARVHPAADGCARIHQRKRGAGVVPQMAGEIGDWLRTLQSEQPIMVRCFTPIVREALIPHMDPALFALPDGLALGPAAAWAETAKHELLEQLEDQEEDLRRGRVLYGASDGALHPLYGNGAYAWVTQYGQFEVGRAPRNILLAELTAIIRFAKQVRFDTFGKAVLFVDSLRAISALRNRSAILWRLADQEGMLQTVSMIQGKRLELVWVRGHNGHALNDVADRLALMRHRAVRMSMDEQSIQESAQHIVGQEIGTLRSTNWSRSHTEAKKDYQRLVELNGPDYDGRKPRVA